NLGGQMLSFLVGKGIVRGPSSYAGAFQNFMKLFGSLGTDAGAIGVEVVRRRDEELSRLPPHILYDEQRATNPVLAGRICAQPGVENGFQAKRRGDFPTW